VFEGGTAADNGRAGAISLNYIETPTGTTVHPITPASLQPAGIESRIFALFTNVSFYDNGGPGIAIVRPHADLHPANIADASGSFQIAGVSSDNNNFWGNTGPDIDLGGDGPTANDALDADIGPNGLTNHPVLATAGATNSINITGAYDGKPSTQLLLRFYSNVACNEDRGPGEHYIGSQSITTDAQGHHDINASFDITAIGAFISATATGPEGTSEFAPCIQGTGLSGRLGDTDCNDTVDPLDALESLTEESGGEAAACTAFADVNCDGDKNTVDVTTLLAHLAALAPFHPGCGPIG
jgi:hypothetical protein